MQELNFARNKNSVVIVDLADRATSSHFELKVEEFTEQRYKSKQINPEDVKQLEQYLKSTNLRTATQKDLVFHLVVECFQNKYSTHYVKKLVYSLAAKLLPNK